MIETAQSRVIANVGSECSLYLHRLAGGFDGVTHGGTGTGAILSKKKVKIVFVISPLASKPGRDNHEGRKGHLCLGVCDIYAG